MGNCSCYCIHSSVHLGKPKATLKNNLRERKFVFGAHEIVKFICEALSYPFPERIEFILNAAVIDENTKGITEYTQDVVSLNVEVHTASFIVNNISGECIAK